MNKPSDRDEHELLAGYDFSRKELVRGKFYSPKTISVNIRLDDHVVLYFKKPADLRDVDVNH